MGVFREKNPSFLFAVLVLAAVFFFCYPVTELGKMELMRQEGFYAALSLETGSFPPVSRAHGEIVAYTYPLYPLLVKMLYSTGWSMEFSLRILSVIFLALLSLVVGFACYQAAFFNSFFALLRGEFSPEEVRKNSGKELTEEEKTLPLSDKERKKESRRAALQAASVGSCIIFATFLAGNKGIEGNPVILTSLLIYGGWLLWFFLGIGKDAWNSAWLLTFLAASAAFYNGGWYALGFFFLPMFFLKRPLRFGSKLRYGGFFAGIIILLLTILLWEIPRWEGGSLMTLAEHSLIGSFGKYLKKITLIPLELCLFFLPWTFFLYAPLCPALISIDRNRLFMKYLRRLLIFALLFFWFNPVTESRDFLLIAPVFATLTALDYWIVVRRYGEKICKVILWIAPVFILAGICAVSLYLIPQEFLKKGMKMFTDFSFPAKNPVCCIPFFLAILSLVSSVLAWWYAFRKKSSCIWLSLLFLFCSAMSLFWAVIVPYQSGEQTKKEAALLLRRALGDSYDPAMTVYMDGRIDGLYEEGFYLGTKIRKIRELHQITEAEEKSIFVLSVRNIPPGDTRRNWSKLIQMNYKNQNLYIWKGTLNVRKFSPEEESIRNMQF